MEVARPHRAEMPSFVGLGIFFLHLLWRPVQAGGKEGKEKNPLLLGLTRQKIIRQWSLLSFPPELGRLESVFPQITPCPEWDRRA